MTGINVLINGKPRPTLDGASLLQLLEELDLDPRAVVVEHNREIVRRAQLGEHSVREGDQIEVVHFVGGG